MIDMIPLNEVVCVNEMSSNDGDDALRLQAAVQVTPFGQSKRQILQALKDSSQKNFDLKREEINDTVGGDHIVKFSNIASQGRSRTGLQIKTIQDGFNSSRTYYLKASTEQRCFDMVATFTDLSDAAKRRAMSKSQFRKWQERLLSIQSSIQFQACMALLMLLVRLLMCDIVLRQTHNYLHNFETACIAKDFLHVDKIGLLVEGFRDLR
jgi:hypothetical protein